MMQKICVLPQEAKIGSSNAVDSALGNGEVKRNG
jgi:hypothetical protein